MAEMWQATVCWAPTPGQPETCTATAEEWFVRWQARCWSQCPAALRVEILRPGGVVVRRWVRRDGWDDVPAQLRRASICGDPDGA